MNEKNSYFTSIWRDLDPLESLACVGGHDVKTKLTLNVPERVQVTLTRR